jgi:hypothetical protein
MADSKQGKKAPKKAAGTASGSRSKTVELAKKLALAVIREHGLPAEIVQELRDAGVVIPDEVVAKIGGYYQEAPHTSYGYKSKKKK